ASGILSNNNPSNLMEARRPYRVHYSISLERIIFHSPDASKKQTALHFSNCGSSTPIERLYFTDDLGYIH
ncbi:6516_t:CDS:1, partial [Acaulospora morrowiae]